MSIFDEIDLTDLDVFAERMPHEWFDALRREHPVWLHPATDDEPEPFWVVSSSPRSTGPARSIRTRRVRGAGAPAASPSPTSNPVVVPASRW